MVIGYILLAISLIELILGLRFIFGYEKSQSTIWYGLFFIGAAIYVGANGSNYIFGNALFQGERWTWFGGVCATAFFLPFSFSYPIARKSVQELLPLVIWPMAVFLPSLIVTDVFIKNPTLFIQTVGYQTEAGVLFWFMIAFIMVYWLWAIVNLVRQMQRSDGMHRRNILLILFGIIISLAVLTFSDIIYPLFAVSRIGYVGSLFTSVWLGCTSYILLKK